MRELLKMFTFLMLLCGLSLSGKAQDHTKMNGQDHTDHVMLNNDKLQWADGPSGLPTGAKLTVLSGDPTKEGEFTIRLLFPANYKIAPHWHPTAEHITVLKGAFYMGAGEKLNMNSATMLQPAGFALMPAKTVHYAFTKEQTVVQVHGAGPFQITYVNNADDPRSKKKMR